MSHLPPIGVIGRKGLLFVGLVALAACSHKNGDGGGGGSGSDDAAAPTPDANFTFTPNDVGAPGQGVTGPGGGVPPGTYPCLDMPMGSCATQLYKAQSLPTDIFVMFDQSGSMLTKDQDGAGKTRLEAVRNGVDQFVHAPESSGLGIGIGYFGYQPLSCACTSCNPADYATPKVPIGVLPDQASAIMASLNGVEPTGETPTGAAIRGACMAAKARKTAEPLHNVVILLVTDGEPLANVTPKAVCNPTLDDAVMAASECASAGISTYVLGVGPSLDNLNKIAAAGQTRAAYLVGKGGTSDIVKALGSIRSDAMIPCALQVPGSGTVPVDFQKVNIVYADASCSTTTFSNVESADKCAGQVGGWYYDNPMSPKQINLCGPTCERVRAAGGQLKVTVGCMTQVIQ
jgi:hypothetical protein